MFRKSKRFYTQSYIEAQSFEMNSIDVDLPVKQLIFELLRTIVTWSGPWASPRPIIDQIAPPLSSTYIGHTMLNTGLHLLKPYQHKYR